MALTFNDCYPGVMVRVRRHEAEGSDLARIIFVDTSKRYGVKVVFAPTFTSSAWYAPKELMKAGG